MQGEIGIVLSMRESPSGVVYSLLLEESWALKKAKKSARFSERVRSFFAGCILPRRANRC